LIAAAILLFLPIAAPAAAQRDASYAALVDQYREGDAQSAISELASWLPSRVTGAVNDQSSVLTPPRQRAAVMLHTDTAYALMTLGATHLAGVHIGAARRLLTVMRRGERDHTFEQRWLEFIASLYTSHGTLEEAERTVRDGMSLYPGDARLYVAKGALLEMRATLMEVDARSGSQVTRFERTLEAAAAEHRRALELDPALAVAHLHLAWVHTVLHDRRAADNAAAALAHAADGATRYLAHLFLGRMMELDSRLDDARREYEAARAIGPSCQTPFIALGRVEASLGNTARARELAREYAALTTKVDDPWWDYHLGGFNQPALAWLRAAARSR
jgi:tetratricopeptide (TPR) repeat protein